MNYHIEKLYLDCIDDSGNCFIIYRAKLDFSFLIVHYYGLIFSDPQGFTIEKSAIGESERPIVNDSLHLNQKTLKIDGIWKRSDAPFSVSLFKDNKNNELIWNCHHPKSLTEINYNDQVYKGFGYAETLSIPIKPWNLPLDELRWGRFLSDTCTVIWINWKGKLPVNRLFLNGVEYNDATFKDDKISFSDGIYQLRFSEILIIRKGKLLNLFSGIYWLKFLFNKRILETMEIKYKAKTIFSKNGIGLSKGWSLFEIVTWAK